MLIDKMFTGVIVWASNEKILTAKEEYTQIYLHHLGKKIIQASRVIASGEKLKQSSQCKTELERLRM